MTKSYNVISYRGARDNKPRHETLHSPYVALMCTASTICGFGTDSLTNVALPWTASVMWLKAMRTAPDIVQPYTARLVIERRYSIDIHL